MVAVRDRGAVPRRAGLPDRQRQPDDLSRCAALPGGEGGVRRLRQVCGKHFGAGGRDRQGQAAARRRRDRPGRVCPAQSEGPRLTRRLREVRLLGIGLARELADLAGRTLVGRPWPSGSRTARNAASRDTGEVWPTTELRSSPVTGSWGALST